MPSVMRWIASRLETAAPTRDFSAESLVLLQRGSTWLALAHTAAHVLGSLACAAIGYRVMQAVLG